MKAVIVAEVSLCSSYVRLYIKFRIFNTNVKSVLLYGCKTWKLTKTIVHQLQVLVSRCIRRTTKIFWPVRTSNQELCARAKQRPIELEIRQRKWGWLGHTLRPPPGDTAKAALGCNPKADPEQHGAEQSSKRLDIKENMERSLKVLAKNRVRWRNFVRALCSLEEWWGNYTYITQRPVYNYDSTSLIFFLQWATCQENKAVGKIKHISY